MLAQITLLSAGLALFGFTTHRLYARSDFQHLDADLRATVPGATNDLARVAGLSVGAESPGRPPPGPGGPGRHGPIPEEGPPPAPVGTYAKLRDGSGEIIARLPTGNSSARPGLADRLAAPPNRSRRFTTGSARGSGRWRVYVTPAPSLLGDTVVVAAPTGGVTASLRELVLLEAGGAAALLVILSVGGWLILRRGLRLLERMADTAGAITARDLSQRVVPSAGTSEVGKLGHALNIILDAIEATFRSRDATEQRLRQFLADAAHELRTPLTSILGFAGLYRMATGRDRSDHDTIMQRIEEESTRMKVLIEGLLLLAQLDDKHPVERSCVDLVVVGADACSAAVADDPGRPITFDAPKEVTVWGDQSHLRLAVANLITNAIRHTPSGTPIDVSVRGVDGVATVSVRDHGPGLGHDALAHAFDRFWQADKARVGTGVGLGLSIVAAVAAEHNGSVTAENAQDGGGLFTMAFPLPVRTDAGRPSKHDLT